MKRAAVFLALALFLLLVVQPNLHTKPAQPAVRVPEYTETVKTNDDVQSRTSESKSVIVIDPGRGGSDVGYNAPGKLAEKDLAMSLAISIGDALEKAGYEVYYTRWYDDIGSFGSETESDMFRLEEASSQNANYLLALRFNTDANTLQKGFSIFTQPNNDQLDALSKQLAAQIQSTNYSQYLGLDNDHYSNFGILSSKEMPAVLIQMGFLTNSDDYDKLSDSAFQTKLANAISQAFLDSIN
ncbi:MAG: N-acetylmuramoyl-L-alanine amidase [Ileibacterium sp.]|nr:N-acetylmuramoyl-L-alanine amidase [Ileibacterium sp.]